MAGEERRQNEAVAENCSEQVRVVSMTGRDGAVVGHSSLLISTIFLDLKNQEIFLEFSYNCN